MLVAIDFTISQNDLQGNTKWDRLKLCQSVNPEWFRFYNVDIEDFHVTETKSHQKFIKGNIPGDYDKNFNGNYSGFLINSPNNKFYIDLDSYNCEIERTPTGKLIMKGMEVDQEVNWVNRESKEIKRIFYGGSMIWIEDAKWIDNSKVVLYGFDSSVNKVFMEWIDFTIGSVECFYYKNLITTKKRFDSEIRLNGIK
jgi:hypothetical protein